MATANWKKCAFQSNAMEHYEIVSNAMEHHEMSAMPWSTMKMSAVPGGTMNILCTVLMGQLTEVSLYLLPAVVPLQTLESFYNYGFYLCELNPLIIMIQIFMMAS